MASVGRPQGFGSDPLTGSGQARGSPHLSSRRYRENKYKGKGR